MLNEDISAIPVSRDVPSMRTGRPIVPQGQIKLTPAQAQMARDLGVSAEEYARGVAKLQFLKSQGHYDDDR